MSLSRQSTNAAREVRHSAISQLQRILLGSMALFEEPGNAQVEDIFNRVIFPLLDDLLKPQVFMRDPQGVPETRLRASALLCKTFMHFEVRESQAQADIRLLWIQILDLLDRLMNIDKKDQLVRFDSVLVVPVADIYSLVRSCARVSEKRCPCYECRSDLGPANRRGYSNGAPTYNVDCDSRAH